MKKNEEMKVVTTQNLLVLSMKLRRDRANTKYFFLLLFKFFLIRSSQSPRRYFAWQVSNKLQETY